MVGTKLVHFGSSLLVDVRRDDQLGEGLMGFIYVFTGECYCSPRAIMWIIFQYI